MLLDASGCFWLLLVASECPRSLGRLGELGKLATLLCVPSYSQLASAMPAHSQASWASSAPPHAPDTTRSRRRCSPSTRRTCHCCCTRFSMRAPPPRLTTSRRASPPRRGAHPGTPPPLIIPYPLPSSSLLPSLSLMLCCPPHPPLATPLSTLAWQLASSPLFDLPPRPSLGLQGGGRSRPADGARRSERAVEPAAGLARPSY